MYTIVVTTKGQIVIPSKIRRKLNIRRGTRLFIEEYEDEIILKPLTSSYFKKLSGYLHTNGKLTRALLEEKTRELGKAQ